MKGWIWIGAGAVFVALVVGCKATRAGYESPTYTRIRKAGKFELRDYPAMVVVSTPMTSAERGMEGGFGRLFRYITGDNQRGEKIAMTTPVLISEATNSPQMSFIVPKSVERKGAPTPGGTNVVLREMQAGRFAVLRFRGSRSGTQPQAASQRLQEWVQQQNLKASSSPQFAYYDPPWIPACLRRNEVMLKVENELKDSAESNPRK
jgi:hypothetical protein